LACGDFIAFLRDRRGDTVASQPAPSHSAGVGTISDNQFGTTARTAPEATRHHDLIEQCRQHRLIVALTTGDHHSQRPALAVDGGVDLGAQPATGSANVDLQSP
jgi:hypothetical protein